VRDPLEARASGNSGDLYDRAYQPLRRPGKPDVNDSTRMGVKKIYVCFQPCQDSKVQRGRSVSTGGCAGLRRDRVQRRGGDEDHVKPNADQTAGQPQRGDGGWRARRKISTQSYGRCCVVAWWARLGAAVHSSDGEDEFSEGLRDPMSWFDVGGQFVMTAVEILDEGVSRADHSR
jgi:hypothetical protein